MVRAPFFVLIFLFAMFVHVRDSMAQETMEVGRLLVYPAPPGTSERDLGKGLSRNLSTIDSQGVLGRAYPYKTYDTGAESHAVSSYTEITNTNEFSIYGRYLFAKGKIKKKSTNRYSVLRIYKITKTVHLDQKGRKAGRGVLVPVKIFYGWALWVVVEGSQSTFTTSLSAKVVGKGASLKTWATRKGLKVYAILNNLTQKDKNKIVVITDVGDVSKHYTPPDDTEGKPILIAYQVQEPFTSPTYKWNKAQYIKPGGYKFTMAKIKLNDRKPSGAKWDGFWGGGTPDPQASFFAGPSHGLYKGTPLTTCYAKASWSMKCEKKTFICVKNDTHFGIKVVELDRKGHEDVGVTLPFKLVSQKANVPIPMPVKGAFSAEVTFEKSPGPCSVATSGAATGGATTPAPAATAPEPAPKPAPAPRPPSPPPPAVQGHKTSPPSPPPASPQKTKSRFHSVPLCQHYFSRSLSCIHQKMPVKVRERAERDLQKRVRNAERISLSKPAWRQWLESACRAAIAQDKKRLAAYSCNWD